MLVLTRQRDESIMIGDDVQITVVYIGGDKVRLGISAPKHIAVHRKEVYGKIRSENREASRLQPKDIANLPPLEKKSAPEPEAGAKFPRLTAESDPFLLAAIEEAVISSKEDGVPIGCVLVRDQKIISRGHDRRVQRGDALAHAEIDCLTNAGKQAGYQDTTLYTTLMPCYLCAGAVVQLGIPRVVVGESVNYAGAPRIMRDKGVEVVDLHDAQCRAMMAQFIREHADLWTEGRAK